MIYVGIADVTPLLSDNIYQKYYEQLPVWRREKADRIKQAEGRAQSVGVWILRDKLRRMYNVEEEAIYNLSHSGSYAMCACSDAHIEGLQVGCDVEKIGIWRPEIVQRFFCQTEQDYIAGRATEEEKIDLFYRYWVWKESFMKATCLGMRLAMDSFEILPNREGKPELLNRPTAFGDTYYFQEYSLEDIPYKMAVCSNSKEISSEIQVLCF